MPYTFCPVCKLNTKEGRRHLYTKAHQQRLHRILDKEKENYRKYKIFLNDIRAVDGINKQPDFRCIFCDIEVKPKFKDVDEKQLACIHIFTHMATTVHQNRVKQFFKNQNADQKLINEFILSKGQFDKYQRKAFVKEREIEKLNHEALNLRMEEKSIPIYDSGLIQTPSLPPPVTADSQAQELVPEASVQLYKDNTGRRQKEVRLGQQLSELSKIKVPPLKPGEGNVYTEGSVPPWLQPDTEHDSEKPAIIGPSVDAFLAAKKAEKLKKLNPNRVGANLDRSEAIDKNWVPNFGRVWNYGTRRKTRNQFKRESEKGNQ